MSVKYLVVAFVLWGVAAPARAEDPVHPVPLIRFMPRYDFHIAADHLSTDDIRFVWDANFGGEVDFVDYGIGRATFAGNFETVMGNQFRNFDPNQGNYLLDSSLSLRDGGTEVAALFHHTSRHLSDRSNRVSVAWNMLGARVHRGIVAGKTAIQLTGDVRGVLLKNHVDYNWEAGGDVHVAVPLRPAVSVITSGRLQLLGVDGSQQRGTQTGGRAEAGLRFTGEKGAIELVVAAERRVDPYPLEFSTLNWISAGFRFVSR